MSQSPENKTGNPLNRRDFVKTTAKLGAAAAITTTGATAAVAAVSETSDVIQDTFGSFFQKHYRKMTPEELKSAIERIERKVKRQQGADIQVGNTPPIPGVVFGYAINIAKCKGYRKCVDACVAENNQGRNGSIQYIRVLELNKGDTRIEEGDGYYNPEKVPEPGKYYMPIQCMQCENPACTKACPIQATWTEPDGVTVIDYDWCIGCRYCMTACPYWARHFNWEAPIIPVDQINPVTNYLTNRPRESGVVEKCTFCLQRTRKERLPACAEACPTGSRIFGNLLDPKSEIRYVLENKQIFRLKEDLGTEPKFWYFTD